MATKNSKKLAIPCIENDRIAPATCDDARMIYAEARGINPFFYIEGAQWLAVRRIMDSDATTR